MFYVYPMPFISWYETTHKGELEGWLRWDWEVRYVWLCTNDPHFIHKIVRCIHHQLNNTPNNSSHYLSSVLSLSDQTNRICLLRWRELAFQKKVSLLYFQNALLRRCGIKIQIWNRSRIRINYRSQRYNTGSQEGTYMAANYSVWKSIWHKMWVDMKWQYPPYSHFFTCMITYSHIISVVPSSTLAALKRIRSTQKDTTECSSKKTTNVRC